MDTDKSPIYKPSNEVYEGKGGRLYSGCFINMQVEFWAQDNKTGRACARRCWVSSACATVTPSVAAPPRAPTTSARSPRAPTLTTGVIGCPLRRAFW